MSVTPTNELINHVVDRLALSHPDAIYGEWPRSETTYDEGFRRVSFRELARAIDYLAHWIVREIGSSQSCETLAYIGVNDILYPAVVLASIKAGYKTLLLSPRNSVAAQNHLMKATGCEKILTPVRRPPAVTAILSSTEGQRLSVYEVPSAGELLSSEWHPFPYRKSFVDAAFDPLVLMHTSGSTGLPKPILWKQNFPAAYAKQWQLKPPPGMESIDEFYKGNRVFITLPPFHAAYWALAVVNGIYNQTRIVFPLCGAIPTVGQLSQALKHTEIDTAFLTPSMMGEFEESPALLDHLAEKLTSKRIICTGGDVPESISQKVLTKIDLINFYGTSEFASLGFIRPNDGSKAPEDWRYFTFHPQTATELRPFANEVCELVITRNPASIDHQAVFTTFPDVQEWRTKDLWTPHSTKPNLWAHSGRTDDIIVFSTNEKMNPTPFEQCIASAHSEIKGIILVGSKRFQASMLIELTNQAPSTDQGTEQFINKIWPSVEQANKDCPAHARVTRSHIWFTAPERPMKRSPKGTIQRAATLSLYAEDLDRWYAQANNQIDSFANGFVPDVGDSRMLAIFIAHTVRSVTGIDRKNTDNFFLTGMDSLQALILAQNISHTFDLPSFNITSVYNHPSIAELVKIIQLDMGASQKSSCHNGMHLEKELMSTMLHKLLVEIDEIVPRNHAAQKTICPTGRSILLTGSTGSLGTQLLYDLLERSEVDQIYCINRASKREVSHRLTIQKRVDSQRITFLQWKPSEADLAIPESITNQITDIVHNAWSVNFNTSLKTFEDQLQLVVRLVQFANAAPKRPKLTFVSSVSAVSMLSAAKLPETVVEDMSAPDPTGYGQSKYIGERLLAHASTHLNLRVQILRIGQVAGSLKDSHIAWNRHEWFPSIILSSNYISMLPKSLPGIMSNIDWIPVDELGHVMVETVIDSQSPTTQVASDRSGRDSDNLKSACLKVYNLVNPHRAEWSNLIPHVLDTLPSKVDLVSFPTWLQSVQDKLAADLETSSEGIANALRLNPATKLIQFYAANQNRNDEVTWALINAGEVSPTFRSLQEIQGQSLRKWIRQWLDIQAKDDTSVVAPA